MTEHFSWRRGYMGLCIVVVCLLALDAPIARFLHTVREANLIKTFSLLCSFPFYLLLFCVPFLWKNEKGESVWKKAWATSICAFVLVAVLKACFMADRPFDVLDQVSFDSPTDYGFPSGHATVVFALLPIVNKYGSRIQQGGWLVLCALIAFARLYLGVHFVSDVVAGMMLGLAIGQVMATPPKWMEQKILSIPRRWSDKETARQIIHIATGVSIVGLLQVSLLTTEVVLVITVALAILLFIQKQINIPLLHRMLLRFDRERDIVSFPGKGAFFFWTGCAMALLIFPANIALASIMILALGDGMANIVGAAWGKQTISYNPSKHYEGTVAGMIAGTLGAMLFVPLWVAIAGSVAALLVESLPLRMGRWNVNDNISMPIVAGFVMTGLTLFI